jgi:DUF1680 family protein
VRDSGVWVNLFLESELRHTVGGAALVLRQRTDYPWEQRVRLGLSLDREVRFALHLRVPGWCDAASTSVNGSPWQEGPSPKGYLVLERVWQDGDIVELELPLRVRLLASHPKNVANYGKVVIARGPLVYCLEEVDNPGIDLFAVVLAGDDRWTPERRRDLLGDVVVLEGPASLRDDRQWDRTPYRELGTAAPPSLEPIRVRAIPYYAWANRGRGSMVTALPAAPGAPPRPSSGSADDQ